MSILKIRKINPQEVKTNLISGLTVVLAMMPEAIQLRQSRTCQYSRLYATVIIALITATFVASQIRF